ncbi:MAG: radical SAM protein [archaeon]|nr:radical SAM protein [archaeon]
MIKTRLIWNITNKCPYDCSFCCVNANSKQEELSLEAKLSIVDNLDLEDIKIDISGGEPLLNPENLEVLKKLSKKFDRSKLSITSTGKGLERVNLTELSNYVSELEFSYDFPREPAKERPRGYNEHNLRLAKEVAKQNMTTTAQTTLIKTNINQEIIKEIYLNLVYAKIDRLLLIKFSTSGRGESRKDLALTQEEVNKAIREYKRFEKEYKTPIIKISPSLRGNLIGKIFTSLNITSQGLILTNPWAYDLLGEPKPNFILGDIKLEKLSKIAGRSTYQRFLTQLKRNILG